ncbi:MAG TPA: TIGR00296 family protein [Nitrososphaeraceae archaeon]|jgi:uncharacterized protein (TIGR00296 family)|nr:TIGR00296 family protein [Nitrososphaeraceae archaeon]
MNSDDLTFGEGTKLVRLARTAVESYLKNGKIITSTIKSNKKAGIFVTLYQIDSSNSEKKLRGCIGHTIPSWNIHDTVISAAINAATKDPRFIALSQEELENVIFEVSVLTKPTLIQVDNTKAYQSEIVIGRDGLLIESKYGSGLFLPQVPVEQKWTIAEYLTNLCYKAGAPVDAWKLPDSKLYKFHTIVFSEKLPNREIHVENNEIN